MQRIKYSKMKRIILIITALLAIHTVGAQTKPAAKPCGPSTSIVEMVTDLSVSQKRKLDVLQKDSKKKIDALKQQREALRDSIHSVLSLYGDHSAELYPMFDREAALQLEINRELYRVKTKADEILTREQHQELIKKMESSRKPKRNRK